MIIEGEIAYFGLQDWWLNELTVDEQNTILSVYKPRGGGENSLIKGKISYSSGTAIGLLSVMSSWFTKPEHRKIRFKIITKAEKLVSGNTRILDLHFMYQLKIQAYYRNRDNDEIALSSAIEACKQQISISEIAKIAFKKEMGLPSLPSHVGYKQLCIILEKQKKYDEVIRLAKIANKQGWDGDWDKRIEKCKKKMENITR
jgi:hypothetical protein